MRQFLQWTEAAAAINTDSEGLRQALAFGLWKTLRAYLRADERAFIATLHIDATAFTGDADGFQSPHVSPWDSNEPVYLGDGRTLHAWSIRDDLCECEKQETSQSVTGYPAVYLLHGFVCVQPEDIKRAADAGHFGGIGVSLPSWWGEPSPVPLTETGAPKVTFMLLNRGEMIDFRPPPRDLHELWFRAEDVGKIKIQQRQSQMCQHQIPIDPNDVAAVLSQLAKKGAIAKLANDPKQAAKAEAFQLWKERHAGKHPKLRTNEQFATECMRRWPVLTSSAVITGWCTEWSKAAKARKS